MRNYAEETSRTNRVTPASMFNLLRAAYGPRAAEGIFRSFGLQLAASVVRCVQKSRI